MRKVIIVGEEPKEEKALRPIEFTYFSGRSGWEVTTSHPVDFEKIVYLGKCRADGDMFAAYGGGHIKIYKGHLNDGVY